MNLVDPAVRKALSALRASPHASAKRILANYARVMDVTSVEGEVDLAELADGSIRFAYIDDETIAPLQEGRTVGFRAEDMPKTVLVPGLPGTGKTTLFFILIASILRTAATIFVIDRKGTDFQYLAGELRHTLTESEMLLLRASPDPADNSLFDNPFERPTTRMSQKEWDIAVTESIAFGVFDLQQPGAGALLEAKLKAASRLSHGEQPSIYHLLPEVIDLRPKTYAEKARTDYYTRAEQRIRQAIEQAPIVFSCTRGIPFAEFVSRRLVIFDLSRCGMQAIDLITHVLFLKLFKWSQYETAVPR